MPADNRQPGLPLSYFLEHHPATGVLAICDGCQRSRRYELQAVVTRLAARGLTAPSALGIRAMSAHVRGPCPRCQGRSFTTRPDWPMSRLPDLQSAACS